MMRALRPLPGVYAHGAPHYVASGIGHPIPLKPRSKKRPPAGFTGGQGRSPTARQLRLWLQTKPRHNVALRLAAGVLGLDVDCYDGRLGARTLEVGLGRWGPLPATIRSSSRLDGLSGIYLFRVPPDVLWPAALRSDLTLTGPPGNIELIHAGLRYATCWPSLHPNGLRYWWWDDVGKLQGVPLLEDLPYLPQTWVQGLTALRATAESSPGAMAAAWAHKQVAPADKRSSAVTTIERQAAVVASAREGQRNEVLNRAAFWLGGDLRIDQEEAEIALVAAARQAGLSHREAQASFRSGWSAGRQRPYR